MITKDMINWDVYVAFRTYIRVTGTYKNKTFVSDFTPYGFLWRLDREEFMSGVQYKIMQEKILSAFNSEVKV